MSRPTPRVSILNLATETLHQICGFAKQQDLDFQELREEAKYKRIMEYPYGGGPSCEPTMIMREDRLYEKSLSNLSLTCKRLREVALVTIWKTLEITQLRGQRKLDFLPLHAHHVQTLYFRTVYDFSKAENCYNGSRAREKQLFYVETVGKLVNVLPLCRNLKTIHLANPDAWSAFWPFDFLTPGLLICVPAQAMVGIDQTEARADKVRLLSTITNVQMTGYFRGLPNLLEFFPNAQKICCEYISFGNSGYDDQLMTLSRLPHLNRLHLVGYQDEVSHPAVLLLWDWISPHTLLRLTLHNFVIDPSLQPLLTRFSGLEELSLKLSGFDLKGDYATPLDESINIPLPSLVNLNVEGGLNVVRATLKTIIAPQLRLLKLSLADLPPPCNYLEPHSEHFQLLTEVNSFLPSLSSLHINVTNRPVSSKEAALVIATLKFDDAAKVNAVIWGQPLTPDTLKSAKERLNWPVESEERVFLEEHISGEIEDLLAFATQEARTVSATGDLHSAQELYEMLRQIWEWRKLKRM